MNELDPREAQAGSRLRAALGTVGTLGAPTGVVALFCRILDVPDHTTAAISLATIFIVAICLFREPINRRVPAALLLGLIVGLGIVFFLNFQNILLKDTGLIRYFKRSADFQAEVGKEIEDSRDSMWFFGVNFSISTTDRKTLLLTKLNEGVKIRYLIYDPYSSHIGDLARDFDQSESELRAECIKGFETLLEMQRKWRDTSRYSKHPGELEIRLFDLVPHARIYMFDPNRETGSTFFIPYVNEVNSPDLPGYLLQNIGTGVFGDYEGGVEKMWQQSLSLTDLRSRHPEITESW